MTLNMTPEDYANWIEDESMKADAELRVSQDYPYAYGRVHSLVAAAVAIIRNADPAAAMTEIGQQYDKLLEKYNAEYSSCSGVCDDPECNGCVAGDRLDDATGQGRR
jgi:hypothetical protein